MSAASVDAAPKPRTVTRQLLERKARLLLSACEGLHEATAARLATARRIVEYLEAGKSVGDCPGPRSEGEIVGVTERMGARVEALMEAAFEEERIAAGR